MLVLNMAGEVFCCYDEIYGNPVRFAFPVEFENIQVKPKIKWMCDEILCDTDNKVYYILKAKHITINPITGDRLFGFIFTLIFKQLEININIPENVVDVIDDKILVDADGLYYYIFHNSNKFIKIPNSNKFKDLTIIDTYPTKEKADLLGIISTYGQEIHEFYGLTHDGTVLYAVLTFEQAYNILTDSAIVEFDVFDPSRGAQYTYIFDTGVKVIEHPIIRDFDNHNTYMGRILTMFKDINLNSYCDKEKVSQTNHYNCVDEISKFYAIYDPKGFVDYFIISTKGNLIWKRKSTGENTIKEIEWTLVDTNTYYLIDYAAYNGLSLMYIKT